MNVDTGYADYMDKYINFKVNHLKRFLTIKMKVTIALRGL